MTILAVTTIVTILLMMIGRAIDKLIIITLKEQIKEIVLKNLEDELMEELSKIVKKR